jgi:hypothetical protein
MLKKTISLNIFLIYISNINNLKAQSIDPNALIDETLMSQNDENIKSDGETGLL